jgi:hypothetical protein
MRHVPGSERDAPSFLLCAPRPLIQCDLVSHGKIYRISGGALAQPADVQIYGYGDVETAAEDATGIGPDGQPEGASVDWIAPPYFYRSWRVLAIYVGNDQAAVSLLNELLGPAFAVPNTSPTSSEPPERVAFDPGAISAQRSSLLPSGPGVKQYVLAGSAGQTMTVDATSDDVPLAMTIESPAGMRWIPEMRPADDGYHIGQQLTLPQTGDYLVTLTKADHTPSTNYTITFTIQ